MYYFIQKISLPIVLSAFYFPVQIFIYVNEKRTFTYSYTVRNSTVWNVPYEFPAECGQLQINLSAGHILIIMFIKIYLQAEIKGTVSLWDTLFNQRITQRTSDIRGVFWKHWNSKFGPQVNSVTPDEVLDHEKKHKACFSILAAVRYPFKAKCYVEFKLLSIELLTVNVRPISGWT